MNIQDDQTRSELTLTRKKLATLDPRVLELEQRNKELQKLLDKASCLAAKASVLPPPGLERSAFTTTSTMSVDKNDTENVDEIPVNDVMTTPIYATFALHPAPGSKWSGNHEAMWPDFWTCVRKKPSENYYRQLKEEFY